MPVRQVNHSQDIKWIYRKVLQASLSTLLVCYSIFYWFNSQGEIHQTLANNQYQTAHNYNELINKQVKLPFDSKQLEQVLTSAYSIDEINYLKIADEKGMAKIILDSKPAIDSAYTTVSEIHDENNNLVGYLEINYNSDYLGNIDKLIQAKNSNDVRFIVFLIALASFLMSRAFYKSNITSEHSEQ
ncbi:hypothetical protein [Catenovulum maritimum]|uniref:Smp protein n=1 Tax=Catenovulum maritimum TaxID=1513271 RepID=A0A0J8JK10_9ALTE|nr:hypothetical protein [Catenovulum maritimum]KMT64791.1 hypothetical protein XM47_13105 [Catenovulum maritimum]